MSGNLVRIIADRNRCVGAGQCVLSAPDVFDQSDEDGRVVILPDPRLREATVPNATLREATAPTAAFHDATALTADAQHSVGPLVDEAVAHAAVDLCPSGALSLARP